MKLQVESDHYFNVSYNDKNRFISYWHQINDITKLNPKNVLEIGIGNGFVAKYLEEMGVNIITLDIDQKLNPTVNGSILNLPFSDNSFDVVACYEVLEHLKYGCFNEAISEIFRVSKSHAVLSLPDTGKTYRVFVQIPKVGVIKKIIPVFNLKKEVHKFNGEHYWEIGKKGYHIKKIIDAIRNVGFMVEDNYRLFENPYHRFLLLKKK